MTDFIQHLKITESVKESAIRRGFSENTKEQILDHIQCEICEAMVSYFKEGDSPRTIEEIADVVILCTSAEAFGHLRNIEDLSMGRCKDLRELLRYLLILSPERAVDQIERWFYHNGRSRELITAIKNKVKFNETRVP